MSVRDLQQDQDIHKVTVELVDQLKQLFGNRTDQGSPFMDPDEAASYLKIDRKLLLELGRRGQIPRAKVGKFVRFHREDLDQWMRDGGTEPRKSKRKNRSALLR